MEIISTQTGGEWAPVLLTVDGCGYRDGACAARVDVAKSIRE